MRVQAGGRRREGGKKCVRKLRAGWDSGDEVQEWTRHQEEEEEDGI